MIQNTEIQLILASASAARQQMLRQAGLEVVAMPAYVDEAAVKGAAKADGWDASELALALAELKAQRISGKFPAALVIGADQMLVCDDDWFDKPKDLAAAAADLSRLAGRTHHLPTAVCVYLGGAMVWHHVATPSLTMRSLSPGFIAEYLAAEGNALCGCVGAYRLEASGSQLFDRIDGDFFTILGLPLLPLLDYLRQAGVLRG
jgi:septum formation protein